MTNSTIDDAKIILFDRWPGVISTIYGVPPDGFTGADHHNVATAKYPVGTKIQVYDNTNKGYAIFIYLQYIAGTKAATKALAAKEFVAMDTSEQATAATSPTWFKVGDDGSECLLSGPLAVALSAMTTTYFGWFWCSGVCPVDSVAALGGTYVTDGSLTAGTRFCGVANASAAETNGDRIILKLASGITAAHATGTISITVLYEAGMSLIADT